MTQQASRVQTVWFSELERWDVNSFQQLNWKWPPEALALLGSVLERRVEEADKSASDSLQLLTLRFDGTMEPRKTLAEDTKGALYVAEPGDVVFSRIDVRNGAIGIVPQMDARAVFSNEFPIFRVRSEVALPDYVRLVFRTAHFRAIINGLISGASGRKRVQPAQLESLQVPLPPLDVQRAIVEKWRDGQRAASQARERIAAHQAAIEAEFLEALGLSVPAVAKNRRCLTPEWKDLERWSFSYLARTSSLSALNDARFEVRSLGEIAQVAYGISKSPANRPDQHARPYLRVANVQRGALDLREIKYINVPDDELSLYLIKAGDLLVCEGNSAALVGRPAIWRGEIPGCVHQNHILRVRVNPDLTDAVFVLEWMQTPFGRDYFRARAKFTTNLASINSTDLRELPIVLPPLEIQRDLVAQVEARRAEIARERHAMDEEVSRLKRGLEAVILGAMPVELLG